MEMNKDNFCTLVEALHKYRRKRDELERKYTELGMVYPVDGIGDCLYNTMYNMLNANTITLTDDEYTLIVNYINRNDGDDVDNVCVDGVIFPIDSASVLYHELYDKDVLSERAKNISNSPCASD